MKIIVSPANYQNAVDLINQQADVLLLSDNQFAVRNQYNCSLEELKKLVEQKKNTQIWVNVNAFFYEQDLEALTQYLKQLSQLNIDRVIFNDLAVPQIDFEEHLNLKLHYDPNTLVTSYGQFDFYVENGFKSVSLSNELFLPEVLMILKNKPNNLEISMQVNGLVFIMHSRWNLVTNFQDYVQDKDDEYVKNKMFFIREESREWPNIIYEDQHGTHMYTGYELCLIEYLDQFKNAGLDYIKLDNIMHNDGDYTLKLLSIYQKALSELDSETYKQNKKQYFEDCQALALNNQAHTGFIGGPKEIKHYENK